MNYELISLLVFVSTFLLWVLTALQCNRVRILFSEKCPEESQRFVTKPGCRSPKNVTFLFLKDSLDILRRYSVLWKMRQLAIILLLVSLLWPVICMIGLSMMFWDS